MSMTNGGQKQEYTPTKKTEKLKAKHKKGSMNACLKAIAKQLGLDSDGLQKQAASASYADMPKWTGGSGSIEERRILYAIVRLLAPQKLLDLGTGWGGSATQFLAAIQKNKRGSLFSIDHRQRVSKKHRAGAKIPSPLRKALDLQTQEATDFLSNTKMQFDFIYEDCGYHTYEQTRAIYNLALPRLTIGGVIISHDAIIKPDVEQAILESGIAPVIYLTTHSACGLSIWQNK